MKFFLRKKTQSIYLKIVAVLLFLPLLFTGCSSKYFSPGWDFSIQAEKAFQKKDYSSGLFLASESIKTDYKLVEPKVLLKDNHEKAMASLNETLKKLNASTVKGAENKYYILSRLAKYYNNLKIIEFPLVDPDGEWSFEAPELLDYNEKAEKARLNAYKVLLKHGNKLVAKNQLKEATDIFQKAIKKYQIAGSAEASAATDIMHKTLTTAYYKRGLKYEKKGKIKNLEIAVNDYEQSLKWDSSNTKSKKQIVVAKNKIAEIYYKAGRKLERRNKQKSANAYASSLKWVPGYKDSKKRIVNMLISGELKKLVKNIAVTEKQVALLRTQPAKISKNLDKAMDAMKKMTYLSDKLREANDKMHKISQTLSAFNSVPVVNTATRVVGGVITNSRKPFQKMVKTFDKFEKPVINPSKDKIGQIQTITKSVESKIRSVSQTIKLAKQSVDEINQCIEKQENPDTLLKVGEKIKVINKPLVNINRSLRVTNKVLNAIGPTIASIAKIQPLVSKAANE